MVDAVVTLMGFVFWSIVLGVIWTASQGGGSVVHVLAVLAALVGWLLCRISLQLSTLVVRGRSRHRPSPSRHRPRRPSRSTAGCRDGRLLPATSH